MPTSLRLDHAGITVTPEAHEATVEWYARHLGFHVAQSFDASGKTFTFLVNGTACIEVMTGAARGGGPVPTDLFATLDPTRLRPRAR